MMARNIACQERTRSTSSSCTSSFGCCSPGKLTHSTCVEFFVDKEHRWWIAGLVLHRTDSLGWLKPFLLWLAITLRLIFFWIPITVVTRPMHWTWNQTGVRVYQAIPEKLRIWLAALVALATILVGSFV